MKIQTARVKIPKQSTHFKDWLEVVSKHSSFHGFPWYLRTKNELLKHFIVAFAMLAMIILPVLIGLEAKDFLQDPKVSYVSFPS